MRAFINKTVIAALLCFFCSPIVFAQPNPNGEAPLLKIQKEDESVLQRHNPFYFAYGNPLSKIQFSFKSPIVRHFPLFFGYTQVMFWALNQNSRPFRDSTYNPELFYRLRDEDWKLFESIDFGAWSHNSNGKDETDSRSYEKSYLRVNLAKEGRRWVTRFSAEAAYLHGFDKTNKDIYDYVGPVSLFISFVQLYDSWIDKSEITFKASPGGKFADKWDQGGYQLSWSFRIGKHNIVPAFYMQYYHGYAESLINYNKNVDAFRGGIIF